MVRATLPAGWGDDMDILSFRGRANRMDFWMVSIGLSLLHVVVGMLAGLIIGMLVGDALTPEQQVVGAALFALTVQLLFLWPITAVAVRRSHDRNMSGWWYGAFALFSLAATIAGLALQLLGVEPQGETEAMIFAAIAWLEIAVWLVFLVILGFLPGTRGANRFGPAPNSRHENYRAPPVD